MKIQLVRHATIWLEYAGSRILIDPMFSDPGVNPPIANSGDERRNPLVTLPRAKEEWLSPDVVLVTHLHLDHWDPAAAEALPKPAQIFCQPDNRAAIAAAGFEVVTEVETSASYRGISIHRTDGRHGTGEIGRKMGKVSGFVLQAAGEPTLYIAGDTIWCEEARNALNTYRPDVTIVNAGGARFMAGDAITMDADDVVASARYAPYTRIVAVHMDTINHCRVTRDLLRQRLADEQLLEQVGIPQDGEWI